ncbi:unnamed protein product [Caenorhabditis nigoni]
MENPDCECAIASKQFQKKLKISPVLQGSKSDLSETQRRKTQERKSKNLGTIANFPGTAFFISILGNVLEAYLSKAVTEAIKLGNQNPMCCSCGPGVSCMENPNCECAIASKQFQKKLKIPPVVSFLEWATLKSFFIAPQKSRRPSRGTETSQTETAVNYKLQASRVKKRPVGNAKEENTGTEVEESRNNRNPKILH